MVRDRRCNPNIDREIEYNLKQAFDSVETANVVEGMDSDWSATSNTSARAANIMFRTAAKHIQLTNPQPFLWLEPDVVILKSGWVDAIAKEYDSEPRKPFMGDFVNFPDVPPHMSGIAVYPGIVVDHAPSATMASVQDTAWDVFACDEIVPRMKQTAYIRHQWKFKGITNESELDNLLGQLGDACVFHQDKSGTVIDFLRRRKNGVGPVIVRAGPVTTDIFIKTYPKDYEWLNYCLRSIEKFAKEFRRVWVLCPAIEMYKSVSNSQNFVIGISEEMFNDKYLSQQAFKLYADTYTDADWILFTDSDTIFTRPVTPDTYLKNGKPVWMITPMKDAHPNQQNSWAGVMQKFMGKEPTHEFMRRHPNLVPRWALQALREFCLKQHGVELKDYIMSQPYREFSEWNVLGFYLYEYHREKFEWFNTAEHPESEWPVLTVDQRWSHNPIPKEEWEQILSGATKCEDKGIAKQPDPLQAGEESPSPTRSMPADSGQKGVEQLPPSSNDPGTEAATTSGTRTDLIDEVARMFTSPLAKGRIMKRLKAAPIIK